jgi:hypothetical protein
MPISYVQALKRAWQRMKGILFSPFELKKWVFIGFSAWVAGLLNGSGGGGPRGQWNMEPGHPVDLRAAIEGMREGCQAAGRAVHHVLQEWPGAVLVFLVVPLILAVILALVWLTSRFKFIYLDNLVRNEAAISEPWRRLGRLGDSLFLWRVGYGLVVVVVFVALSVVFGGLAIATAGERWTSSALVVGFGVLFFAVAALVAIYIHFFLESFIVPIMYRLGIPATAAWREFLPLLQAETLRFVLYGFFVLALFIAAGLAIMIFGMATCCVGFFLLWLPYVGTVLLLPLYSAYRLLGPEFLAQFDPRFDLFAAR